MHSFRELNIIRKAWIYHNGTSNQKPSTDNAIDKGTIILQNMTQINNILSNTINTNTRWSVNNAKHEYSGENQ